ncbi:AAA domain-containing protein [Mycena floridula]|nr:AAA domain-containing protein [Mycena floridula]
MSSRRLAAELALLQPTTPTIGTLKLGNIEYGVTASQTPSRLVNSTSLLDIQDSYNLENLHFMLEKFVLGQDIFLLSAPGPYARRLSLTFAQLINSEYEYISLHRDVGETELKQGREIRASNLTYIDSAAVQAVKNGRILIVEGVEKAERGIMPILNNLLENREINLEDGTHIIHPHRYAAMLGSNKGIEHFIPAHKNFRVIAIGSPVPPYPGFPTDPPFRSRFQCRFIDPLGSSLSLSSHVHSTLPLWLTLREIIISTQISTESRHALETVTLSALPPFPQTALVKLGLLMSKFPPPTRLTPGQLARIFLLIHPTLLHAPFQAWALLSRQTQEKGLGELGSPSMTSSTERVGFFGYKIEKIEKGQSPNTVQVTFEHTELTSITHTLPAGPFPLKKWPLEDSPMFCASERFNGLLTCLMQAHLLGNLSLLPPPVSAASSSTSTLVKVFGQVLGYEIEVFHLYKEISGRELIMRRVVHEETTWESSLIIEGGLKGKLVHLSGLDVIGATAGSLSRLVQDNEVELWHSKRIVAEKLVEDYAELSCFHPSFRVISTASKSIPLKDWLTEEHANMFYTIPLLSMQREEEEAVLLSTGCPAATVKTLLDFAETYRESISNDNVQRNRKLGTRSLLRIAKRIVNFAGSSDLHTLLRQTLMMEFLPIIERRNIESLLAEFEIQQTPLMVYPSPQVLDGSLVFPATGINKPGIRIPIFNPEHDPEGASLVPSIDAFFDNSLQTSLMRDLAIDLELQEHLVLLGNQGVGKNIIVDRLLQLLGRPREYIQLHRDTTAHQLMFTTNLENGVVKYTDSPLLRAIRFGRHIVVDEADKAPEHVVAIFRSLATGELTLPDGRHVRSTPTTDSDIVCHPSFRLILLANRPGYPFLGNHFLQVLGENFSTHSVPNPDQLSERQILTQLAPRLSEDLILRLVGAFDDLRKAADAGHLSYPYSLRELINIVKHLDAYPEDSLGEALRNVFDFDIYNKEAIDKLSEILERHGLHVPHLGIEAARESRKKILDVQFEPKNTELGAPKEGVHDDKEHSGGNTYAGGTGGRDTAGMGGRGGYKRFYKGGDIKQVSDALKDQVPEHIKEQAREMARQELQRLLEELELSPAEATGYGDTLKAVNAHMVSLYNLFEHLSAKEEERVWMKRQTDGELDDSRLTEGITGEASVYKRRTMSKPEIGRPQIKPKRIRFIFDLSASMYRFQYDGRLQRSIETAVMLMETFDRLSHKEKYVWDIYAHSGDGHDLALVTTDKPPTTITERVKVTEKMMMVPQYAFAGDYTVEAIEKGVKDVAKFDADDWHLIAITDANFGRYRITGEHLAAAMKRYPKVNTALICIGEGAEAEWVSKALPGRAWRVKNTSDIPIVLRSILSRMIDRGI